MRGWAQPRSPPQPEALPCAPPAPRSLLPGAAGRDAGGVGETRKPEAPSGVSWPVRGHRAPSTSVSTGFLVCSLRAGGRSAGPLRCLHAARRAGTGTTTRGSTTHCTPRPSSLILVSGVKEPRFPILGERNVLYICFVEGVLSPAKIRCLVT